LITSNLKFKTVEKDRLFYDQYQYSVSIPLKEANALRKELSHESIDRVLERRQAYWATIPHRQHRVINQDDIDRLHRVCDFLLSDTDEYKLVFYYNHWLTIYTNSLALLDRVDTLDYIDIKNHSRVNVNRPRDTIILKNPKHTKRSYFREFAITNHEKDIITNFLTNQRDYIKISPGLRDWMKRGRLHNYVFDYFFIDYSDDQWLTMLSLVRPGLIRKTVKILQAK
jgi:hypothetical protein